MESDVKKINSIITEHLFFKSLTRNEIDSLVNNAKIETFSEGDFLLSARDEAKTFYLILSGSVSLQLFSHERGILELETIQEGEFVGWSWLSSPYKWHFDIVSVEKTQVITFDAKAIKKEMENNPEFGFKIYKIFTPIIIERLQATRKNLMNLEEEIGIFEEDIEEEVIEALRALD